MVSGPVQGLPRFTHGGRPGKALQGQDLPEVYEGFFGGAYRRAFRQQRFQIDHRSQAPALQTGRLRMDLQCPVHRHAVVIRVPAVAVGVPIGLFYVQFHIAADQPEALHLQQGVPKVRTGGRTRPTRVDDTDPLAGLRAETGLPGGPFLPELGQQPLGYPILAAFGYPPPDSRTRQRIWSHRIRDYYPRFIY